MIYDRDYMQPEYDPRHAAVARPLVIAVILGYIVEAILTQFVPGGPAFVRENLMLSLDNVAHLRLWTFATSPFIDALDPLSALWVVLNAVFIHLLGRAVVPVIGARGFWTVAAAGALVGEGCALISGLVLHLPGIAIGASGITIALCILLCTIHANEMLLPIPLPIPVKGKYLAWTLVALQAFSFIFFELRGQRFLTPPSSLLGAMLAGWLYHRLVHRPGALFQSSGPGIEMPTWMKRKRKVAVAVSATNYKVNLTSSSPADIRAEVDRILDKINSKGFGALTAEERRILDEARDTLNKR